MSSTSSNRRSRGFTIIELLVVITIITLLLALLLPSLNSARDRANEVKCSGNIRMIYTGICSYSVDYHQYIPPAWYITERQWQGWSDPIFLHNMMSGYLDPMDKAWMDPGWNQGVPYNNWVTVSGTPENAFAGSSPGTPHNFGEGYYYRAAMWISWWGTGPGGVATPQEIEQHKTFIRFDAPPHPDQAEVLSCMCPQQVPYWGAVGPHRQGTIWNILWLTGVQTQSRGCYGPGPISYDLYCNSAGNWTQ